MELFILSGLISALIVYSLSDKMLLDIANKYL